MRLFRFFALCAGLCLPYSAFAAAGTPEPQPTAEESSPAAPQTSDPAPAEKRPWYRDRNEYVASKSVRMTQPTDVGTKIITDAKRFDMSVGKRIPLYSWSPDGEYGGWSTGIDGGMLASLTRFSQGKFTFATNTFDGYFGAYVAYASPKGLIALFRTAHLSAHLVDNSPLFLTPIGYSQFWNEVIVGHTFPEPSRPSDWDVHVQGSVGFNNTSTPLASQPRAALGAEGGYAFHGPDSLALIGSADMYRAGVLGQDPSFTFFLGIGYLKRPQTTHRPLRAGLVYFLGSDYRNQLFFNRQRWATFEVATEF